MKLINSNDKQFFRVSKSFSSGPAIHTSFNDAKIQEFNGTMVYGSFNQKYYIRFMEELDVIKKGQEFESRWVRGLVNRPLLQNLMSTKYNLVKEAASNFAILGYDSITQLGDVKVLRNKYYLPLGFTYKSYISLDSFSKVSTFKKDMVLQKAFVTENPVDPRLANLKRFPLADTLLNYTYQEFYSDAAVLKKDTLGITKFSQNNICGSIELDSSRVLFLSIPYDKGWHTIVDGKEVEPMLCNVGFIGLFLEPGKHEIELNFSPPFFKLSKILTIIGLLLYLSLIFMLMIRKSKKTADVTN